MTDMNEETKKSVEDASVALLNHLVVKGLTTVIESTVEDEGQITFKVIVAEGDPTHVPTSWEGYAVTHQVLNDQERKDLIERLVPRPKITKKAVIEVLERQHADMKEYWAKKNPQMFREQLHCSGAEDCPERAYWHYGNAVAFGEAALIIARLFADDEEPELHAWTNGQEVFAATSEAEARALCLAMVGSPSEVEGEGWTIIPNYRPVHDESGGTEGSFGDAVRKLGKPGYLWSCGV